jgi:hypothetical protein
MEMKVGLALRELLRRHRGKGRLRDKTRAPRCHIVAHKSGRYTSIEVHVARDQRPTETSSSNPRRGLEHAVQQGLALRHEILVGANARSMGSIFPKPMPPLEMREVKQLTVTLQLTASPRDQHLHLDLDVRQEATEDLETRPTPSNSLLREATGPQERAEATLELLRRLDLKGVVRRSRRATELEPPAGDVARDPQAELGVSDAHHVVDPQEQIRSSNLPESKAAATLQLQSRRDAVQRGLAAQARRGLRKRRHGSRANKSTVKF